MTGVVPAGSSQVTITGLTYTKAESGLILTAARTGGDLLNAGASSALTVNPGLPASLTFLTQPRSTTRNNLLLGPPTVAILDSVGNIVTSSSASVSVAIGNNPGVGALSGTTAKNATSGIARFDELSINQLGNGYTLTATATVAGIGAITSTPFNIETNARSISGIVTRSDNGTPVIGAIVEVFLGNTQVGAGSTNSSGLYSTSSLSDGVYTVRATATGFVPQIRSGVSVHGSPIVVDLTLNQGITIHSPIPGTQVADFQVLVRGEIDPSQSPDVGVSVNGATALRDGIEFAAIVPISQSTTTLTATLVSDLGTVLATHSIPVTVQPPTTDQMLRFKPSPVIGIAPLSATFILTSLNPVASISLDANGDGLVDFTGLTLQAQTFNFPDTGLYFPTVAVTDTTGNTVKAEALLQVVDTAGLDIVLRSKWNGMKNALRSGNTAEAASYTLKSKQASYQNVFSNLTIPFTSIDQVLTNLTYVGQTGANVEYEMLRTEGGQQISYVVLFMLDEDGVWRIKSF